jgi:hypothetical protein
LSAIVRSLSFEARKPPSRADHSDNYAPNRTTSKYGLDTGRDWEEVETAKLALPAPDGPQEQKTIDECRLGQQAVKSKQMNLSEKAGDTGQDDCSEQRGKVAARGCTVFRRKVRVPEVVEGYHLQVWPGENIRQLLADGFEDTFEHTALSQRAHNSTPLGSAGGLCAATVLLYTGHINAARLSRRIELLDLEPRSFLHVLAAGLAGVYCGFGRQISKSSFFCVL